MCCLHPKSKSSIVSKVKIAPNKTLAVNLSLESNNVVSHF